MELLSGNEAIARGAWQAGASIGVGYPGTPSTETMETFAKLPDVYAEWANNEKVAFEVAMGASAAGRRVLVTMKHVGVNVAADPLFTAAYTGIKGGFLILAADDPGMYSSQNEQDSQYYGKAAHIPVLAPSDSQEALDFAQSAYEISERFDIPVMIRSTVRISHTKTPVELGERCEYEQKVYEKDIAKWVMMPAYSKPRRKVQLERIAKLQEWAEECPFNTWEKGEESIGVICAGAAYQHVKDALPEASVLKLGVTWPLPDKLLHEFASSVDKVYVVEEGSDYLTSEVAMHGIEVSGFPNDLPRDGELSPGLIKQAFGLDVPQHLVCRETLPARPPALCAGCPHRVVFKELSRLKAIVTGDIGCYTLGTSAPLSSIDTCLCMGASISMAHGMELAMEGIEHRPIVAVIGDSTFGHSGLSSLISTVYNKGKGTVCVLDNRTTAMTGRQGNPFNGVTLQNRDSRELDLETVVRAIGVERVATIDAYDVAAVRAALKEATTSDDLDVLIFRRPCILLERFKNPVYHVNGNCRACGQCISLGCPALGKDAETGVASIDPVQCIGCGQCIQYCAFDAIEQ